MTKLIIESVFYAGSLFSLFAIIDRILSGREKHNVLRKIRHLRFRVFLLSHSRPQVRLTRTFEMLRFRFFGTSIDAPTLLGSVLAAVTLVAVWPYDYGMFFFGLLLVWRVNLRSLVPSSSSQPVPASPNQKYPLSRLRELKQSVWYGLGHVLGSVGGLAITLALSLSLLRLLTGVTLPMNEVQHWLKALARVGPHFCTPSSLGGAGILATALFWGVGLVKGIAILLVGFWEMALIAFHELVTRLLSTRGASVETLKAKYHPFTALGAVGGTLLGISGLLSDVIQRTSS